MTPGPSTLLLSDFHAGHNRSQGARKKRALDALMLRAGETNVGEIVLAGDIADERPSKEHVREECEMLRKSIDGYASVFLRGNHDDAAYFETSEMEDLLRCRIDERPWHVSDVSGVVVTHGHHFRTPSIRRALRDASHAMHLESLFDERAVRHQKAMNKGFSFAGKVGLSLEEAGFPATELWEHLQQVSQFARARMAGTLRGRRRPLLQRLRERMADAIDLRSTRHAARLARAMGSWGVVSGHTHVPGIYKHFLEDEATGERVPFLVGNSGSFVSRYAPTFIEVSHPRMTLWQFDERSGRAIILQTMELTDDELGAQARFFNCG